MSFRDSINMTVARLVSEEPGVDGNAAARLVIRALRAKLADDVARCRARLVSDVVDHEAQADLAIATADLALFMTWERERGGDA